MCGDDCSRTQRTEPAFDVLLPSERLFAIGLHMDAEMTATILRVIERAPQWLRHDLESKNAGARSRAEETLAAMIADALGSGTDNSAGD